MKSEKNLSLFGVLFFLVAGSILILSSCVKEKPFAVQCIPYNDITEIRIVSNDTVIQKIELLESDGALYKSKDPAIYLVSSRGGSAYIAVHYLDSQGQQDFTKFEILSSPPISLVILQYDSKGNMIGVNAY